MNMHTIEEIKNKIIPIAKKHNLVYMSLFGSYARGEQDEKSDLDFLITPSDDMGLFEYVALYEELEKCFGCHVDVVTTRIDDKEFLNNIKKDERVIYNGI